MSATVAVRCCLLLAALAASALLALVVRLGPCGQLDGFHWPHVVGAACTVLAAAGLDGIAWLRPALLGVLAWLAAGGLLSLLRQLYRYRRFRLGLEGVGRAERRPPLDGVSRALELEPVVDLVADARPLAFTHGLLRPRICVSTGALERLAPDELTAVLAHERAHVERRDPLRELITRALAASMFFVPVLKDLHRHFLARREIEADERAVRVAGPPALASALLKLLPVIPEPAPGPALVSAADILEQRIDVLLGHGAPEFRPSAIRLVVSAGAGLALLCLLLF